MSTPFHSFCNTVPNSHPRPPTPVDPFGCRAGVFAGLGLANSSVMLDLTSMPRGVRDQIALLHVPADFILDSANFSPWDGTLTVELKCVKCGESSTVSGDPFGARWTRGVHHDCPADSQTH